MRWDVVLSLGFDASNVSARALPLLGANPCTSDGKWQPILSSGQIMITWLPCPNQGQQSETSIVGPEGSSQRPSWGLSSASSPSCPSGQASNGPVRWGAGRGTATATPADPVVPRITKAKSSSQAQKTPRGSCRYTTPRLCSSWLAPHP